MLSIESKSVSLDSLQYLKGVSPGGIPAPLDALAGTATLKRHNPRVRSRISMLAHIRMIVGANTNYYFSATMLQ
jgi:hypothetical protein